MPVVIVNLGDFWSGMFELGFRQRVFLGCRGEWELVFLWKNIFRRENSGLGFLLDQYLEFLFQGSASVQFFLGG